GRPRELSRLGAVAALPQAGSPGSGLQATPFAKISSGEKLLCLSSRCGLLSKHCWFRPVCVSSPAIVSAQSWSSGRGKRAPSPAARVVELRSGGDVSARVGRWFLQEGAWAFIVMVTGHPYLRSLLRMLLTMPSYFVVASVVLAVRCAAGEGRSCPPYLCQVSRMTTDPPMLVSDRA
ncbi:hypothetical protein GW17_00056537, partial [Ensete ventricosum]